MIFEPTPLQGLWVISPDSIIDDRGNNAREFCRKDFKTHGIELKAEEMKMLIIPESFIHGFLTLEDISDYTTW